MKLTLTAFAVALLTLATHASPLTPSPDAAEGSPAVPVVEFDNVEAHHNATLDDIHLAARQSSFPVSLLTFTGFQCGGIQNTVDLSTAQHNTCLKILSFNSYRLFQPNGILPPFQVRVGNGGCFTLQGITSVNTCTNVARATGGFNNVQLTP
ncbi:hypothetical protein C8Q76DRAFT_793144 [Earliella scabrosa]|nr:hypothetical protein C8Q76DRAFT_793144 [Earliella scabrosa]